jgi:hypothetical protein
LETSQLCRQFRDPTMQDLDALVALGGVVRQIATSVIHASLNTDAGQEFRAPCGVFPSTLTFA